MTLTYILDLIRVKLNHRDHTSNIILSESGFILWHVVKYVHTVLAGYIRCRWLDRAELVNIMGSVGLRRVDKIGPMSKSAVV